MKQLIECTHCNGYGSSFKDPGDERCSQCGGTGLKVDQDAFFDEQAKQGMEEVRAERINDRVISGFYFGGSK
jgi:DnaJ-class molecular chaperone